VFLANIFKHSGRNDLIFFGISNTFRCMAEKKQASAKWLTTTAVYLNSCNDLPSLRLMAQSLMSFSGDTCHGLTMSRLPKLCS